MNTKKGFTLVELLVVIAILAILATVSVVGYTSFIDRANQSNLETEAHQIEELIDAALLVPGSTVEIQKDVIVTGTSKTLTDATAHATNHTVITTDLSALGGELKWDKDNDKLTFSKYGFTYDFATGKSTKDSK